LELKLTIIRFWIHDKPYIMLFYNNLNYKQKNNEFKGVVARVFFALDIGLSS